MSTKNNKKSPTGVRYSDAQKKEVVDFVAQYNSSNGRGGQSAAAKKFKVTPLTISAWIKSLGGASKKVKKAKAVKAPKAPKAPKAAKAPKAPKAAKSAKVAKKSGRGVRYSAEQKKEVVDFVSDYNAANGRGGQSQAAKKFGLSVLTVSAWLKSSGAKGGKAAKGSKVKAVKAGKAPKAAKSSAAAPSGLSSKIASLIEVSDQLRKAEGEAEKLRAKYDALRASIQALI